MNDEFILALLYEDDEEHVDRLMERHRLQHLRDLSDPFTMEEPKFVKLFRLPPRGALSVIDRLSMYEDIHQGDIPAHIKVLSALNFFGQGSYQTPVGQDNFLGLSQPTVSKCLRIVADGIVAHLLPNNIKFPETHEERAAVKQGFQTLGFPNVIGAVDGTHIAIIAPPDSPEAPKKLFYNRKGYYSINAQVICDAKGRITHVNPNFPGSTHDSAVWGASNINTILKEEFVGGERSQWLLGDKGYPLVPWLMTPYTNPPADSPALQYNKAHAKTRIVVELCFGKLKNRFRCLLKHRILHYQPKKAAKILLSCCTLHNMFVEHCIDDLETPNYDHQPTSAEAEEEDHTQIVTDFSSEGLATRDLITQAYFTSA